MSFVSAQKSRLIVGDFSLSALITQVDAGADVDMLDVTTVADGAKAFLPGTDEAKLAAVGYLDVAGSADAHLDQLSDWKAASAAEPVTYGPNGLALGAELWMVGAFEASFKTGAARSGVVSFDLAAQADGPLDMLGRSLHDLTARTADGSGSSYNNTAATTTGGVAHLHVTAFSGFSGVAIIVEDSANDSTWATIGTFTTAAGLTSQRLTIAGTIRQYVRVSWDVTGSGSITFAAGLARR